MVIAIGQHWRHFNGDNGAIEWWCHDQDRQKGKCDNGTIGNNGDTFVIVTIHWHHWRQWWSISDSGENGAIIAIGVIFLAIGANGENSNSLWPFCPVVCMDIALFRPKKMFTMEIITMNNFRFILISHNYIVYGIITAHS